MNTNTLLLQISERLKVARESANLELGQVSKKTDIDYDLLKSFESGENIPEQDLNTLIALYKVNSDWMRGKAPNEKTQKMLDNHRKMMLDENIIRPEGIDSFIDHLYMISSKNGVI